MATAGGGGAGGGAEAGCGGGGGKDALFVELWKACAGPPSSVLSLGEKVYYFPQGHIEQGRCIRYWFEEEYVVYLHDNGYLSSASSTLAAASTTEVPKVVGRLVSLEQNLKEMKDKVGKNRDGMGSCICLVCGCVNVTIFLVLAICLVLAVVLK